MAAGGSAGRETPDVSELRREVSFLCDTSGMVMWADEPAGRLLGVQPGESLVSRAAPGTELKVERLLQLGAAGSVRDWEACLLVEGVPRTALFSVLPYPGHALLIVGNLVPEQYSAIVRQVNATIAELGTLQRQTERQQRELQRRHDELQRLNRELDDSARGMAALHAEVEESADSLRRLSEVKSRVVSNVSHEFRTPLNSIIGLTNILLSRVDGDLSAEQEKQITFIRRSAKSLTELVNDLLDLSSIEAGKVAFRPTVFTAGALFGALRGMMRPLVAATPIDIVFDSPVPDVTLETDEGKVSQVLRNLLSNALKFTPAGEVRVTASADGDDVLLTVRDTGIGIPETDHERIFEEFTQLDNPVQRHVKGTGLGLALSRRLATILGGTLTVQSAPGDGATFTLRLPRVHPEVSEMADMRQRSESIDPSRAPILVLEDDRQTLFLYERYLRDAGFQIVPARTVEDAREAMSRVRPAAIVLDVMLEGETSWGFLAELKATPETRNIPTLVVTITNREDRARALGADEFVVKPLDREWMVRKLQQLARRNGPTPTVLVVDDDEVARYMLRRQLADDTEYRIIEAASGAEGLRIAQTAGPQVIFLDVGLPGENAFDLLDDLKSNPVTRNIPVIIHTSKSLADEDTRRLSGQAAAILPKQHLSREVATGRIRDALVAAGLRPPTADREANSAG